MQSIACARSDVGRVRAANEDFFAIRPELELYVVADGMGGHGNGEVASRLATMTVCRCFGEATAGRAGSRIGIETRGGALRTALEDANEAILKAVADNTMLTGMGSTAVALTRAGDRAAVAHVGDSRAYRLRGGKLELLTEDHTWVRQQVALGELTLEEARHHPFRNVVTRALGGELTLRVDLAFHDVQPGDQFLLCTDGLTGVLGDEEIAQNLGPDRPLEAGCRDMIATANLRGGPDNITVLVVSFPDS